MKLGQMFKRYKFSFGFTLGLLLLEAAIAILFPLFIGKAIDSAIQQSYAGVIQLGLLGLAALVVGMGRRVFDSRFYAKIYQEMGSQAVAKMQAHSASVKVARLGMIQELVEFLENSLPELIGNITGLAGVILIIATLNLHVFYGSLGVTLLIALVYALSSMKTLKLNQAANDEAERQVEVIAKNESKALNNHLEQMMKWNIKLSDLEAKNFSLSWVALTGFLVLSIVIAVSDGMVQYGALFSLIMYVFQYMEHVVNLPLFYQHGLRLKEILSRLAD